MERRHSPFFAHNSPQPSQLLLSNQPTCTGCRVDLHVQPWSSGVRTYTVSVRDAVLVPLSDMVLAAFGLLFLLPQLRDSASNLSIGGGAALPPAPASTWQFSIGQVGTAAVGWTACGVLLSFVLFRIALRLFQSKEESVCAINGVGLQFHRKNVLGRMVATRFVDHSSIRALVIHEGYYRHQAIFYLAIVVEGEEDVLVVFEETLPRVNVLKKVLRGLRCVLYGESEEGPSLAEMQ